MSSEEVWDPDVGSPLLESEGDDNFVDQDALRPIMHRVLSELLNASSGTLSLAQLRQRLVAEEVLTPQQASSQSKWIERETQSFLAQNCSDEGDSDTGSHQVRSMENLSDLEEGVDIFANVSQIFGLESESSEAKRRKTVPLNLSQQGMDEEDDEGEADEKEAPDKSNWRRKQNQRKRAFLKWYAGALDPTWPKGVATDTCARCKKRKVNVGCKHFNCNRCCAEGVDPCERHHLKPREPMKTCAECGESFGSRQCPSRLCMYCCFERRIAPCEMHVMMGKHQNLAQLSLKRGHMSVVADGSHLMEQLSDQMFTGWSRGALDVVAAAVKRRIHIGLLKRDHATLDQALFELCAFMTGVAQQIDPTALSLDLLHGNCRAWLSQSSRFGVVSESTRILATRLVLERVLPQIRDRVYDLMNLQMLEEQGLFDTATLKFLHALALESGLAQFGVAEPKSSARAYMEVLELDLEMVSHDLVVAVLAGFVRVSQSVKEPLMVLFKQQMGRWLGNVRSLMIFGESVFSVHDPEMRAISAQILATCPTFVPALCCLCEPVVALEEPLAASEAVMRALLVWRETNSEWWGVLAGLLTLRCREIGPLEIFFFEELFTYWEGPMSRDHDRVGSMLVAAAKKKK